MPVELLGLDKFDANVKSIIQSLAPEKVKDLCAKAAVPVWSYARSYAPYDPNRKKGTHLRDAILISKGPAFLPSVLVAVRYKRPKGAPHAHLLEFGTVKMAARPFIRPAAVSGAAEVQEILNEGILELIQQAVS